MSKEYWEEWVSLGLGIWLFLSPWMLRFFQLDMDTINFLVMGVMIAIFACMALYMHMHALWEDWVTLILGMWMIISPHVLGFSHNFAAGLDATVVGIFLVGLALFAMNRDLHHNDKGAWSH